MGYPGQLEGGSSPLPEGGRPSKHGSPEGLGVFSVGVQKPQMLCNSASAPEALTGVDSRGAIDLE